MLTSATILISIIATIVLGTGSNWFYDILRARNFLPANPSWKRVTVLFIASVPLIGLVALPELIKRDETVSEQIESQSAGSQVNNGVQIETVGRDSFIVQRGNVTVNHLAKLEEESIAPTNGSSSSSSSNVPGLISSSDTSAPSPSTTSKLPRSIPVNSRFKPKPVTQVPIFRQGVGDYNKDIEQIAGQGNKPTEAVDISVRAEQPVNSSTSPMVIEQSVGNGNRGVKQVAGVNNQF